MGRPLTTKGRIKKLEHLHRDYLILCGFNKCCVCGRKTQLCLEHCFSRDVKQLFFDLANHNIACRDCNYVKWRRPEQGVALKIHDLTCKNVGEKKYREMYQIAMKKKPMPEFRTVAYLDSVEAKITKLIESVKPFSARNV